MLVTIKFRLDHTWDEYMSENDELLLEDMIDREEGKDDGAYANIAIPIKYVHQLQQALRIAGMTDFANNFKV